MTDQEAKALAEKLYPVTEDSTFSYLQQDAFISGLSYNKEDALAFGDWLKENAWQSINITMQDNSTKTIWSSKWGKGEATTEQLYSLFKQQK